MKTIWSLVLLCPLLAQANVIYSSFGAGMSYSTARYGLDGNAAYVAWKFQASNGGTLDSLSLPLFHQAPSAQAVFRLYDGTSSAFVTQLEAWTVTITTSTSSIYQLLSVNHPVLTAGSYYWLSWSEPNAADGQSSLWNFNNIGLFDTALASTGGYLGYLPAFELDGVDSPEPGTLVMLAAGLGLGGFGLRRQRRRRSDRCRTR